MAKTRIMISGFYPPWGVFQKFLSFYNTKSGYIILKMVVERPEDLGDHPRDHGEGSGYHGDHPGDRGDHHGDRGDHPRYGG